MKSIVESAGGKLLSKQPSFRTVMEHKQNKVGVISIFFNGIFCCKLYQLIQFLFLFNVEFVRDYPYRL